MQDQNVHANSLYLSEYSSWLISNDFAPETRRSYLSNIRRFFEALSPDVAEAAFQDAATLQCALRLHSEAPTTRACFNGRLSALSNYCRFRELPFDFPSRKPRPVSLSKKLSLSDQEKFIASANRSKERDRLIALLLLNHGLRLGECERLNLEDIVYLSTDLQLLIPGSKAETGRNSKAKPRCLSLEPAVRYAMEAWLSMRENLYDEPALFVSANGRRLSKTSMDMVIRAVGLKAGIVVSAQVLRNTCLAKFANQGHDELAIARLGGYMSLAMPKRYAREVYGANFQTGERGGIRCP